jgi:soluble lytic murein transglycosylase-like protein
MFKITKANFYMLYAVSLIFLLTIMYVAGVAKGYQEKTVMLQKELFIAKAELKEYKKDLILASENKIKSLNLGESELKGFNSNVMSDLLEERVYKAILKNHPNVNDGLAFEASLAVVEASKKFNLSIKLLLAMGNVESNYQLSARSNKGALGILQVMPFWKDHIDFIKNTDDLRNTTSNILAGAYILRKYLDSWQGDMHLALLSYNRGITKVKRLVASNLDPDNDYSNLIFKKVHVYI